MANGARWQYVGMAMVLILGLLLVTPAAEAQRGGRAGDGGAVRINVSVTGKDGTPVRGLTARDFEVAVAGRAATVTHFEAVELTSEQETGLEPLAVVVVVDLQRLGSEGASRGTLTHLQEFLRQDLPPGSLAMVVTQQRGLRVRQDLTGDLDSVVAALEALKGEAGEAVLTDAEERRLEGQLRNFTSPMELQRTLHSIQAYAMDQRALAVATARHLGNLMDGLAGVPGRKVMVYVGEGLTLRPAESLFQAFEMATASQGGGGFSSTMAAESQSASPEYQTLVQRANSAGVTIYPLVPHTEGASPGTAGRQAGRGTGADTTDWINKQAGFVLLADGTGGRILLGTAEGLSGRELLGAEFRYWYVLGFSSDRLVKSYRTLRVRARCPDCTVRFPGGIQAKPLEQVLHGRLVAALSLGVGANPWGMAVQPYGDQAPTRRSIQVPLLVRLPLSAVHFDAKGETHEGHLTFYVTVMDDQGQVAEVESFELPLPVPAAQFAAARQQSLGYPVTIQTQPGQRTVGVLAYDRHSGTSAVATLAVEVMGQP